MAADDPILTQLRRGAGALAVDNFFRFMSVAGRLHPDARPEKHDVGVIKDVPYLEDGSPDHLLDVYYPRQRPGPWPVVMYLHGGGFRVLSKDSHWVMGLAYARRGYVLFNVNYRLAPRHRYPAAAEDACAALSWVLQHAPSYGGDPERLVLAGESAGANLAAVLTLACCYDRPEPWTWPVREAGIMPRAVLPACGIFQVSDPERYARKGKLRSWVVDRVVEVRDAYLGDAVEDHDLADPLLVLERGEAPRRPLPPFHLAVGTRDPLIDDTRRLEAALLRLNAACEAHYYPGQIHAFQALAWRGPARDYWRSVYQFLQRYCPPDAA